MLITREHLEARLAELRMRVRDPAGGIYGPGSHAWELKRETINFLGGARAALLQLAHPYVAHGIDQHSKTKSDIQGRFQRTFINVFAMTFGDLDRAFKSARAVHNVHTRIRGTINEDVGHYSAGSHYEANDLDALIWVWATLMDSIILVHRRFMRPLAPAFVECFYQETKKFAALFGLSEEQLPASYQDFRRYFDGMVHSDAIAVGGPALQMSKFLLVPPAPSLRPIFAWYRVITAGLLPPALREQFEMRWGRRERAAFAASAAVIAPLYRATPRAVRYLPAYVEARQRLSGAKPSPVDGLAYKLAIRGVTARMAG